MPTPYILHTLLLHLTHYTLHCSDALHRRLQDAKNVGSRMYSYTHERERESETDMHARARARTHTHTHTHTHTVLRLEGGGARGSEQAADTHLQDAQPRRAPPVNWCGV